MKKYGDRVGKIYLYLFSMLGLVLVVIGSVGLINLGLKTYVFDMTDPWLAQPPMPPRTQGVEVLSDCDDLSEEDLILINLWLEEYENWTSSSQDRQQRYRDNESAASNLALLIVGLPLFLFHWNLVRKKTN